MSENVRQQVDELLMRAYMLPHSAEQVELNEEAARLADAHGDVTLGFEAREALIESATFAGYPEKALVAFTWCLGQCDKEPERFQEQGLLWQYKWIAADLPYFPQIKKQRILEVHEDMQQRYDRCGQSLQPIFKIRWLAAMRMGEREDAERYYAMAKKTPRDQGSDCEACELDDHVSYLLYTDQLEQAVEKAGPILSGRMSCASVPHVTLASLLRPLLRLGRLEEAARFHRWGYRLIGDNRKFVDAVADHLEFLALTDNPPLATRVFEDALPAALETTDLDDRFHFLCAVVLYLRCLDEGGRVGATLPAAVPLQPSEGTYPVAALRAWFEEQAQALGARFDARNENDAYAKRYGESCALAETLRRPFPLGSGDDEGP